MNGKKNDQVQNNISNEINKIQTHRDELKEYLKAN